MIGAFAIFPPTITASAKTVKYVYETKDYKINGKVIFKLRLKRAKLLSNTNAAKKVNSYLSAQQTKLNNKYLAIAKKYYHNGRKEFPHNLDSKIILTYNKNGKYSFKMTSSGFAGGVHTWAQVTGFTFSKTTGKRVSAVKDIKNKAKFLNNIKTSFKNKYGKSTYQWLNIGNKKLKHFKYYLKGSYYCAVLNYTGLFAYGTVNVKSC